LRWVGDKGKKTRFAFMGGKGGREEKRGPFSRETVVNKHCHEAELSRERGATAERGGGKQGTSTSLAIRGEGLNEKNKESTRTSI